MVLGFYEVPKTNTWVCNDMPHIRINGPGIGRRTGGKFEVWKRRPLPLGAECLGEFRSLRQAINCAKGA